MDFSKHANPKYANYDLGENLSNHADAEDAEATYQPDDLFPIMSELELMNQPQITYLVEQFVPEDTVVVFWGESQSCKSFFMVDMCECMSHGFRFHGLDTKQCAVAYIVAEGARGVGKRVRGWKQRHEAERIQSPFYAIPTAVNILKLEEVEKLIWQLQSIEQTRNVKFGFVGVDTLAKCMVGGDENHARDMGISVHHCDIIRERMGCSVGIVHHCGKDIERGPRGSYALYAGVNTSVFIERTRDGKEDFITACLDKQKDDDDHVSIRLNLVKVMLPRRGGDNPHKPESTLILDTYKMDCPKAAPELTEGRDVDPKYADLVSIAMTLADNSRNSASKVAKMVFKHDRAISRVLEAVPAEWTEVKTNFDIRYVRLVATQTKSGDERHHVECRHLKVG